MTTDFIEQLKTEPENAQVLEELFRNSQSKKNAQELEELFRNSQYETVRFLVDPRKNVSKEAMVEDFMVLLKHFQ
jgi:hypothetical protein